MSKAKKRMYTETYYSLTEDQMQSLIIKAKTGDGAAQVELLEIFSNFLNKYTAMLYYGRYSFNDYDIRQFIALFVKDKTVHTQLRRNRMTPSSLKYVREVMRGIQYMAQRYGDEEDIHQTVQMTFVQCLERYERKGEVPFSGYLYSYYFYLLKKNVDIFLIDQLGRKTFPLVADDDQYEDRDGGEVKVGFTAPPSPSAEDLIHAEEIDEYWVAGDTAQPPFDKLTIQERQLLRWRFVNGERSSDIANRITEHPNTVREHFNRIRGRIATALEELEG